MRGLGLGDSLAYDHTTRLHAIVDARCLESTQVGRESSYFVGVHSAGEKNSQEGRVAYRVKGLGKIHCHCHGPLMRIVLIEAGDNIC